VTAEGARQILYGAEGRLRLGWRLCLFVLLLAGLYTALGALLPSGMLGQGITLLGASLLAGWAVLALDGLPAGALGFPLRREALSETLLGTGLGCVVGGVAVVPMAALGVVRWSREDGTLASFFTAGVLSLALFGLLAAAEEAVLRGYPLQAISDSLGPLLAVLLTSVAFGLLHLANPEVGWPGILNTSLAGAFLGALYLRTGSLWWASGAHLGWNWMHGFLLDLPVSGLDVADQPFLASRSSGPDLLSGGAFGPEGSLLATAVLLGVTAWVWRTRALGPADWTRETPLLATLHDPSGTRGADARITDTRGHT
jgi:membrane protease YdiL (CAAX protease family)